jgi:hypothetical protein
MFLLSLRCSAALALLFALTVPAAAEDACSPVRQLPAGTSLTLDRYSYELAPSLSAQLENDQPVNGRSIDMARLGLTTDNSSSTLRSPLYLPQVLVGFDMLKNDRAQLGFQPGKGQMAVISGGRSFMLNVREGKVYGQVATLPLDIQPNLFEPAGIVLQPGTVLRRGAGGAITAARGSTVQWVLGDDATPLPLMLSQSAVLEETNAQRSSARITAIQPERVLPGGGLKVSMQVSTGDLNANPPIFCFSSGRAEGGGKPELVGVQGTLIGQSGNIATFNVRVPDLLHLEQPPWSWINPGARISLRVLSFGPQALAIDSTTSLAMTSRWQAGIASLVITCLVVFLSASILSNRKPVRLLSGWGKHRSGRYSLANFQIALWTLLVLYSLCYVWYATGEILSISSGILVLLGISGTTSVASYSIEALQNKETPAGKEAALRDLVSTDGNFDPMRFQMLGFTLFTWVYALVSVLKSEGLPEIPEHLYILMGISNTSYVASKLPPVLAGTPASTTALTQPGDVAPDVPTLRQFQAKLKVAQTGVLDEATRAAIINFKKQNSIIPASPLLDAMLLEKVLKSA